MSSTAEWMVAEAGPLPRRWRRLGSFVAILLLAAPLTGSDRVPSCSSDRSDLGAAGPMVPDLRFSALHRPATPEDVSPLRTVPEDVNAVTRRLTTVEGATVWLLASRGFSCLVVDGTAGRYGLSTTCRLNSTIVDSGLWTTAISDGPFDDLLIVAIPDGSSLVQPTPRALTESGSFAVFRRSDQRPIYLHSLSGSLVLLDEGSVLSELNGQVHGGPQPLCG